MEPMTPNRAIAIKLLTVRKFKYGLLGFKMLETLLTDILDGELDTGRNIDIQAVYRHVANKEECKPIAVEKNIKYALQTSEGGYSAYTNKVAISRLIYEAMMCQAECLTK